MVNPFKFILRKRKERQNIPTLAKSGSNDLDFIENIRENPRRFAKLEHKLTHKPTGEILREIYLGLKIINVKFKEIFHQRSIAVIPPKYEFWTYLLLSVKFATLGYSTKFLYPNWSRPLIDQIKLNLKYLKYQNLSFVNVEDFKPETLEDARVLNFSESFKGVKNTIPSFSTAVVDKDCDLDYAIAYILVNTFSFAGMKKSNLKRIIIDKEIRADFERKINNRIEAIGRNNGAKIRSKQLKQQIHELVSEAVSEGADLLMGGDDFENDHYRNIIVNDVTKDMRIFQKKFYGPVMLLSYCSFDNENLSQMIGQQPSKGIIVFTNNVRFVDLHQVSFIDKVVVERPFIKSQPAYMNIIEHKPTLEILFRMMETISN